jgi:hypothetical protein
VKGLCRRREVRLDCAGILDAYPDTLLGNPTWRERYRLNEQMLFFHRHPSFFAYVLYYYIQGFVQRPGNIPYDVYIEECRFFSIPLDEDDENDDDDNQNLFCRLDEMPAEDVFYRKSFHRFGFFVTILSCLVLFSDDLSKSDFLYNQFTSDGQLVYNLVLNSSVRMWIDLSCTVWFMIEFYIRFFYLPFTRDFQLFIDIVSISPVFLFLLTHTLSHWFLHLCLLYPFYLCLKSFRVLRLVRYISGLEMIRKTLLSSLSHLVITLSLCSLFIVQWGSVIYLIERTDPRSTIVQPNHGLAWAVETLMTIGFGEYIPHTGLGRILAILTCVFGLILLALPIPMIFRTFQTIHQNSLKRDLWLKYR